MSRGGTPRQALAQAVVVLPEPLHEVLRGWTLPHNLATPWQALVQGLAVVARLLHKLLPRCALPVLRQTLPSAGP